MNTDKIWQVLGQGLAILTLTAALAACGGSSDAGSSAATAAGTSAQGTNPSVSGTPATTVAADNHYSFRPTLGSIPADGSVSFSIRNKPSWATFAVSSGELSGTPSTPDKGVYPNIVISATTGSAISELPAFSIEVTAASTSSSSSSSGAGAAATQSASGTMIPTNAKQITDSAWAVWTLNGGVVYQQAATAASASPAGYSANVIVLLYYGGTIYQENKTCLWWSWNGSTWVAVSNPDPAATPACSSSTAAAASVQPATVAAPTGVVGVQVSGNKLLSTQDGSVVHLRGVNLAGFDQGSKPWIDYACFGGCTPSSGNSEPNFAYLAQLHFNAVRIPLIQENWLGYACYTGSAVHPTATNTTPNAAMFQAALIKTVADATAAGLYVILDLHWSAPNDPNTGVPYCSFGQGAAADADHSIDFWISIANTFKNNPAVLFELYNEPFLSSCYDKGGTNPAGIACSLVQSTWTTGDGAIFRNGGTYYPFIHQVNGSGLDVLNITWHVAGMQDLVNGIRTTGTFTASNGKQFTGAGAKNVILSASIGWNQNINLWPEFAPSDPTGQLAASWHVYSFSGADNLQSATVVATGNCNANSGAVPDCGSGVPIVITEFQAGFGNNLSSQNNKVANWSDSTSGGSGYMYWAFVPWGNYGDDGIETAACGTGTYPLFANGGTCGALTNQGKLFATGVACAVQGDDCWANVN